MSSSRIPHPHLPRSHRMRVLAAALTAAGITILAMLVLVRSEAIGTPPDPNLGHKVTICHANEGVKGWNLITVDVRSSGLEGGHDSGNGVHAGDIIPPFDWVDNKDVLRHYGGLNMGTTFDGALGSAILANGCRVPDTPPPPVETDVCRNIDGVQTTVPTGMVREEDGDCITPQTPEEPPVTPETPDTPDAPTPPTPDTPTPDTPDAPDPDTPDDVAPDSDAPDDADDQVTPTGPTEFTPADDTPARVTTPLPFTGSEQTALVGLALAFIAVGLALELGHRRRHAG